MRTNEPAAWFRLYAEFAIDPKVQMMSETDQRRYIMLLCLRCSNGCVTLHDNEVAFQLRITDQEWMQTKGELVQRNLIDEDNKPTAWEKRQRASDTSAERVAKHRALHKTARNDDVTLQKRQVETETEIEKDKKNGHFSPSVFLKTRGVDEKLARDWLALRKAKKLPATETAINGIEAEAAIANFTLSQAITECCHRGWGGFKAAWLNQKPESQEAKRDWI